MKARNFMHLEICRPMFLALLATAVVVALLPLPARAEKELWIEQAIELGVDLPPGSIPLASQSTFAIAFRRYRIYFYNETNATARSDLHVYLTR